MDKDKKRDLIEHLYVLLRNEKEKLINANAGNKEIFDFEVDVALCVCVNLLCNILEGFNNVEIQKSFAFDFIESFSANVFKFVMKENQEDIEKLNININ